MILTFLSIPDREKLLSCSIDGLELFSCSLSNEDETALSILDPVTIAIEIKPPESRDPGGSGQCKEKDILPQILEVRTYSCIALSATLYSILVSVRTYVCAD